jgi:hypothetical protein
LGAKDSTLRWVVDTCAHETGHIFGRWHTCTPEGKEPWCDKKYPHYQGAISDPTDGEPFSEYSWYVFQGFDITQPSNLGPIQAFDTKDIMSYNPGGRWISDYTYLGIMNYRNQTLSTDAASSMVQAPGTYLLASGLISVTQNTATFGPLYQIPNAPGQTLPTPGDYSLRLLDSDGATLADYPFAAAPALEFPPEAEPVAIFSLVMPSIEGTTQVQVISGTQVLATQLASSHAPTITLTTAPPAGETVSGTLPISWTASDEDGDDLSYVVFYSADDGQTWTTQTTDWISDTFKLYTQALPGSQQARVRVLVSDGFYIAQATSAAFTVAPHSPEPFIFLPEENGEYPVGALVSLQGSAYDREDGSLSGASLTWTSSVDGNIGTDSTLYLTNLSPGLHTITLTATDSDAMSASASVNIYIGSAVYLPVIMR